MGLEYQIAVNRIDSKTRTDTMFMQMAIASVISKDAGKLLTKSLAKLSGDGDE